MFVPSLLLLLPVFASLSDVVPRELYKMVDFITQRFFEDSCIVVFTKFGYTVGTSMPTINVQPFEELQDFKKMDEKTYKQEILIGVLEAGCIGYVIQSRNPGNQLRLIEETFILTNQRNRRKFIFLPAIAKCQVTIGICEESLDLQNFNYESIFEGKSVSYIPDIVIAVPKERNIELLTHFFGGSNEESRKLFILDKYNVNFGHFESRVDLFPDKIKDLKGKVLKTAVFHYPPYVLLNGSDWKNNSQVDGTEWRLVKEFAKLHNCSLECVVDEGGFWGTIYDNYTGDGILGNLVEDRADIGLAALYTWYHESLYLDLTMAYIRTGITCLVPAPEKLPSWLSPFAPFSPKLWAAYIFGILVSIISTYTVNRSASKIRSNNALRLSISKAVLEVVAIAFQQGLSKDPEDPAWSTLSTTILITSLLLTAAYASGLAAAITLPRYEVPIDTIEDMVDRNLIWAAIHDAWVFSILEAEEPELKTIVANFRTLEFQDLVKDSALGRLGFGIERLPAGHYAIQEYLDRKSVGKMHLMTSDIYWEYCVSMLRKSSPLTEWYSLRTLEILASGIPAYWEAEVVARYLDYGTQQAVQKGRYQESHGPVIMTLDQVQGIFFILFVGQLLGFLAFLKEIWTQKKKTPFEMKNSNCKARRK